MSKYNERVSDYETALDIRDALSEAQKRRKSGTDVIGHSSVQPWSAGPLFPAVIAQVERRTPNPYGYTRWYELILDGITDTFVTWDQAAQRAGYYLHTAPGANARRNRRIKAMAAGAVAVHGEREVLGDFHGQPIYADEQPGYVRPHDAMGVS